MIKIYIKRYCKGTLIPKHYQRRGWLLNDILERTWKWFWYNLRYHSSVWTGILRKITKCQWTESASAPRISRTQTSVQCLWLSMIPAHTLHQWQMNSSWCVSNCSAKCSIYHYKVLRFQYLHIFSSAQAKRNCAMNVSDPSRIAHSAGDLRTSNSDRHCAAVFHIS